MGVTDGMSATGAIDAMSAKGAIGATSATGANKLIVKVPATSANLGIGFDCLGLALDLYATFTFELADALAITGCEERFQGEDNLVWTTYVETLEKLQEDVQPVAINIDSPIPLSGGLGSSSTCVVAGIAAALEFCGRGWNRELALQLATETEGHPDNVAPAIYGGLVNSLMHNGAPLATQLPLAKTWQFVLMAPPYEVRTADARKVLPDSYSRADAVWQIGHAISTGHALGTGDAELLAASCIDKIHEPYRKGLIADYEALREAALGAGATAFVISGSGSTMMAICAGKSTAVAVASAAESAADNLWIRIVPASFAGTNIL